MGYWISKDGDIYNTGAHGHFGFVKGHPAKFGMTKKEAEGLGAEDHQPTIDHALTRGWIRVMGTRPNLGAQFAVLDQNTIFALKTFFQKTKMDPSEKVLFEEVATGASWYEPSAWIMTDEALKVARNPKKRPRIALSKRR